MKLLAAIIFIITFVSRAQAGIFIEPQAGFSWAETNVSTSAPNVKKFNDDNGLSFGGKAGFYFSYFELGADYVLTKLDDTTLSEWTALAAVRNDSFRLYAGYIFNAESDDFSGDGMKFGFTYYLLPIFAFNLEYRKIEYDSKSIGGFHASSDYDAIAVFFSVPLHF